MGKKDKDKKDKSKNLPKKPSPQSTRSVTLPGTDSAIYNAVPGSDTEDATNAAGGGGNISPQVKPSKRGKADKKKGKKKGRKNEDTDADDDSGTELKRKPSPVVAPLPQLSKEEYDFFEMVKSGDVDQVAAFLLSEGFKGMNINKTDKTGYTVLHLAVRRQDEEMVRLLLQQPGIRLYDTLLHSIKEKNEEVTKILLELYDKASSEEQKQRFMSSLGTPDGSNQQLTALVSTASGVNVAPAVAPISARSGVKSSIKMKTRTGMGPPGGTKSTKSPKTKSQIPTSSVFSHLDEEDEADEMPFDSEFPPVITPLMLAAQEGCYPLMELFYSRNERLESAEFPHNVGCECDICLKLDGDQDLTRAYQRYHLFKALTEPDYICFIARKEKVDPVNYAIQKIVKVREIIEKDTAFNTLFEDFEETLEEFMTKMLELCRNTTEAEIFLSPKDAEGKERLPHLYPRLWYTVGLELKHFVTQPNAQSIVYKVWATDDWPDWDTYGWAYRTFHMVIRILAFPLIALLLLVAQDSGLGRTLGAPVSRFLTYIGSYIFFLLLLAVQILFPYQRCNDEEPYYEIDDNHCKQRGPPRIGTEWPIVIYVMSFYVSMLKRHSVSWYWSMRWNWFELISQLVFTVTFVCWVWAWIWTMLPENEELLMATDRLMWDHDCAEIFGECFLAVSCLFAFGRLLRFLTVNPTLGPIQIALGKQVIDFISTSLILVVVIFAFSSGMMALYMPYKDFTGLDPQDHKREKAQEDAFHSVVNSFRTFFFLLYEHGGPEATKLLIWNVEGEDGTVKEVRHYYTQFTGIFLFMAYNMIGATMLFEMLSGYFAQTVDEVMENVDIEWKYARTELYLTFIKDTILPPPFNLLPTLKALTGGVKFLTLLGKKNDPKASCSFRQCCYITSSAKTEKWKKLMKGYRKLILQLIFRYRNMREEEKEEEEATKDDVLGIGEELAEIKAMLKKGKGDNAGSDSDDDDDDFPAGGGGGVASAARSKKGWSKTKFMVESAGSTYLKNAERGGGGGGRGGGAGGGSGNLAAGGSGTSQMNVAPTPVVTTQPTGNGSGLGSLPVSSGVPPANAKSQGHSDKMSLMFINQTPSGLVNYTAVNNQSNIDYREPRRGSRGGGGLERSVGLEDFSGPGNVESAFRSPPKSANYFDMKSTPKMPPGLAVQPRASPSDIIRQPSGNANQGSPQSTNQYLYNTQQTPQHPGGLSDHPGSSPTNVYNTSTGDYREPRRGSRGGGGLERSGGLEDFSGPGNVENPFKSPPKSAHNFVQLETTSKRPIDLVDHTRSSPPDAYNKSTGDYREPRRGSRGGGGLERSVGLEDFSGPGNVESSFRSPPKSANNFNLEPTPKSPSGFVNQSGFNNKESTQDVVAKLPPSGSMTRTKISPNATNYQFYDTTMPKTEKGPEVIDLYNNTQIKGTRASLDANFNKTTTAGMAEELKSTITTPVIPVLLSSDDDTTAATDGSAKSNQGDSRSPLGAFSKYDPMPGGFQLKDSQYSYR